MYPTDPQYQFPVGTVPRRFRFPLGQAAAITTGLNASSAGPLPQGAPVMVTDTSVDLLTVELAVQSGGSAPATSALIVDIQRCPAGSSTFSSMFGGTQSLMPTLPIGVAKTTVPFQAAGYVAAGDQLQAYVAACDGTAENVMVTILGAAVAD